MSKLKSTRISSVGIIINEEDKILLCRLSPIVEDYAGYFTLPGGGIDYGEDPKDALVREVKEETNLDAKVIKLLDVNSVILEFSDRISHALRIIYKASVLPGEIIVEKDGSTDAAGWFTRDEVKGLKLTSLSAHGIDLWDISKMNTHELAMYKLKNISNKEFINTVIDCGIYDDFGNLTKEFCG